ncbi:MAG: hypothetical protein ACFFBI_14020 [Promethearchaeota archaeon]
MSSHVDDIVLTNVDIHHSEYEKMLRKRGIDAEVYIKQLMKSLVEIIEMKDQNGNYLKIEEKNIKEILYKNFGVVEGEKVLEKWKSQKDFEASLKVINSRKKYAFQGKYEEFLKLRYNKAYSAYYKKVKGITFTKILVTQDNLDFLRSVYGMRFKLKPMQIKIV